MRKTVPRLPRRGTVRDVGKVSILIVDDSADSRDILRRALSLGDEIEVVGEAGSGPEAVEQAEELSPDVVLMDVRMPEGSGIEATRAITRRFPQTRVVALTAHDDPDTVRDMIASGATGYVVKGAPVADLVAAVRTAWEGKGRLDERVITMAMQDLRRLLQEERGRREEAERLARVREEFVQVLSHELRTPLTVISGTMKLLGERALKHEEKDLLDSALGRVRELEHLVEGLELVGEGGSDPRAVTSPAQSVEQALARLPEQPDVADLAAEPWPGVRARHLARVAYELASNALKHGRRPVEVRAFRQGREGVLEVRDAGDFEPDPELFRAFVQRDMSETRERGGFGLGLFVASRLCESDGGRLELRREGDQTVAEARFLLAEPRGGDQPPAGAV